MNNKGADKLVIIATKKEILNSCIKSTNATFLLRLFVKLPSDALILCFKILAMKKIILAALFANLFGQIQAQNFTTPPPVAVRTAAEWEEQKTLMVTWRSYFPILTEIVRAARQECKVVICCESQSVATSAKNYLGAATVDTAAATSNIQFAVIPTNTVWIRDYGPNTVYANDVDSLLLVDWMYNRFNREKDDAVPVKYGVLTGVPVFSTKEAPYDLVNTGGNFMSDGLGTAFASKLILRNNDQVMNGEGSNPNDVFGTTNHTASSIDQVMAEFMGIDRYIKMDELPYDGIHHIDMHTKLLDEETLLMGSYPPGVSDGPQMESNLLYVINSFQTSFGNPFKVVRIPMPSFNGLYPPYSNDALYPTYANAVFVNKTVIMPKYNHVLDAAAQDTFQKYLPGYEVVQVDCNAMIGAGGAIHCITKEIGSNDPLRIAHPAIRYADIADADSWHARALVQHRSGIQSVQLYYTTTLGGPWTSIDMTPDGATPNYFVVDIPVQTPGDSVYYYIQATANNGKTIARPMTAPEGYWAFPVLGSSSVTAVDAANLQPIFPNPANAITTIPVSMRQKEYGVIQLFNALGQPVETVFEGNLPVGQSYYFIHADRYPAGVYQVVLQTEQQKIVQSLVISGR